MRTEALTVAVSALLITATGCAASKPAGTAPAPAAPAAEIAPAGENVLLGEGRDRTASRTARDWATYADHLLVVTAVSETRLGPSKKETERGEGMIGRTVQLKVDKVLWSAPDAPQPAPAALKLAAAGWVFNNNEGKADTAKFALKDSSRLDQGHTYVKAVEWVDDPCSDDPKKGTWEGLGSGDTIPFDNGVLGAGEFEGKVQTLTEAKSRWQADEAGSAGLRLQVAGSSVDKLVAGVKAAPAGTERGYGPAECNPDDK
jgi:hypothetical protein